MVSSSRYACQSPSAARGSSAKRQVEDEEGSAEERDFGQKDEIVLLVGFVCRQGLLKAAIVEQLSEPKTIDSTTLILSVGPPPIVMFGRCNVLAISMYSVSDPCFQR